MINVDSKDMRVAIKIIGIFCLLVAALIYGEIRFIKGRQIQCYEDGGFLIRNQTTNEPLCKDIQILNSEGWYAKDHNTLTHEGFQPILNNDNYNFSYAFG